MIGLLKIYFIYISGSTVLLGWRIANGLTITANFIDAAFLVIFVYFFMVNLSLYKLLKNEDKETKMKKVIADQREDYLQENI